MFSDCLKYYNIEHKIRTRKNGVMDIFIQSRKKVNFLYSILNEKYKMKRWKFCAEDGSRTRMLT